MKIANILVAVAMVVAMAPAASATSNYDANVNYILEQYAAHGSTPNAEQLATIQQAVANLGDVNLADLNKGVNIGVPGAHVGEVWYICYDFFFGGGCSDVNNVPVANPASCQAIPAHWALYIWVPNSLKSTVSNSGGTTFAFIYTWTESHAGGPLFYYVSGSHTFTGSLCNFNAGFIVEVLGDGVFQ